MLDKKETDKIIGDAVRNLMQFFDSVRIIVTQADAENSQSNSGGGGNFFAQYGSVVRWLKALDKEAWSDSGDLDNEEWAGSE